MLSKVTPYVSLTIGTSSKEVKDSLCQMAYVFSQPVLCELGKKLCENYGYNDICKSTWGLQ